jgi:transcriptional regulator with XRE-family HTH domain
MRLGDLIAVARECKGWTLRDLEKASGVSNALISQIELNKVKDPGFSTVVRIADALGLTIDRVAETVRIKLDVLREAERRKPFSQTPEATGEGEGK